MKCPFCKASMLCEVKDYKYIESGLDNMILKDMDIYKCSCGEEIVNIPAVPDLHNVLGREIIKKQYLLDGGEIRFLRKNIGYSATRLAETMGTDIATISRWEHGRQSISKENDRILRLIYAELKNIPAKEKKELIEHLFKAISPSHKIEHYDIHPWMWTKAKTSCLAPR